MAHAFSMIVVRVGLGCPHSSIVPPPHPSLPTCVYMTCKYSLTCEQSAAFMEVISMHKPCLVKVRPFAIQLGNSALPCSRASKKLRLQKQMQRGQQEMKRSYDEDDFNLGTPVPATVLKQHLLHSRCQASLLQTCGCSTAETSVCALAHADPISDQLCSSPPPYISFDCGCVYRYPISQSCSQLSAKACPQITTMS